MRKSRNAIFKSAAPDPATTASNPPTAVVAPTAPLHLEHTADHRKCPACEAAGREDMGEVSSIGTHQMFSVAAELWLQNRTFNGQNLKKRTPRYIARRTLNDYKYYLKTLNPWFGQIPLIDINWGNIRGYQEDRSKTAEANKINSETAILKRVMVWGDCWSEQLELAYKPLQSQEPDVARAMTPPEQENFLATAAMRSEWELVHWFCLAALKTTLTNCEMTGLRLGDIQFTPVAILNVRSGHAKNKHRVRTIGLASEAVWAFTRIIQRAQKLGAASREHYIFPFRLRRNEYDPSRPMTNSGIKKPFDEVRRTAGVPWLRIHDLRHTGITRLAESGTPMPTIMSMAGHMTPRMMQHYTHIGLQAQCTAQEKVSGKGAASVHTLAMPQPTSNPERAAPPPRKPPSRQASVAGAYVAASPALKSLIASIIKK